MGNKLLYAMEHADRIFAGFVLSNELERSAGRDYGCSRFESAGLAETVRCKETPEKESSMVQPDGETLRISNLICRKIHG